MEFYVEILEKIIVFLAVLIGYGSIIVGTVWLIAIIVDKSSKWLIDYFGVTKSLVEWYKHRAYFKEYLKNKDQINLWIYRNIEKDEEGS